MAAGPGGAWAGRFFGLMATVARTQAYDAVSVRRHIIKLRTNAAAVALQSSTWPPDRVALPEALRHAATLPPPLQPPLQPIRSRRRSHPRPWGHSPLAPLRPGRTHDNERIER